MFLLTHLYGFVFTVTQSYASVPNLHHVFKGL